MFIDYNPISKRWHERMATLPKEKVDAINAPVGKENLIKLKKSKEPVREGDVFVLSIKEGLYFYGKVLQAKIEHIKNDDWYNQGIVIFIFKCKTKKKSMEDFKPDYNSLLIGPNIVIADYWRKGLFETIGNIPLTKEEQGLDYGFYRTPFMGKPGTIVKANGEDLNHMPKLLSSHTIMVYTGIYMHLRTETIIDPALLE